MLLFLALLTGALGYFATDIYLPSLPSIAAYFNVPASRVQATISSYMLGFSCTPLIAGPISDQYGRRPVILIGLFIGTIATFVASQVQHIDLLILTRFCQAIGYGMLATASRAILPDKYKGKDLATCFAYMSILFPLALMAAPLLGGVIEHSYSWREVFLTLGFISSVILALTWIRLPETATKSIDRFKWVHYLRVYRYLLKRSNFLLYFVCIAANMSAIMAYLTISPFVLQEIYHYTPKEYGYFNLATGGVVLLMGLVNKYLLRFFTSEQLAYMGALLVTLGGLWLTTIYYIYPTQVNFTIGVMLFFMNIPITFSNCGAAAMEEINQYFGTAGAVGSTIQLLGAAFVSWIIVLINGESPKVMGATVLIMGVVYFLCLLIVTLNKSRCRIIAQGHSGS